MFCPKCNKLLDDGTAVCPYCAAQIDEGTEDITEEEIAELREKTENVEETADEVTEEITAAVTDEAQELPETKEIQPEEKSSDKEDSGKKKSGKGKNAVIIILIIIIVALLAGIFAKSSIEKNPDGNLAKTAAKVEDKLFDVAAKIPGIKNLEAVKAHEDAKVPNPVIMTVCGNDVTKDIFDFYYNDFVQYEAYYAMQGQSAYDPYTSPEEQNYTDENGKTMTYAEYFSSTAVDTIQKLYTCYAEAVKNGAKLSKEDTATIDEAVAGLESNAAASGFATADEFIQSYYGPSASVATYRKIQEISYITSSYVEKKQEEFKKSITEADYDKELAANYADYANCTLLFYPMDYEDGKENATTEKEAKTLDAKITDEKSFVSTVLKAEEKKDAEERLKEEDLKLSDISGSDFANYYQAEEVVIKWAYNKVRKAGEHAVLVGENGVYLVYMLEPNQFPSNVTVRYCLCAYNDDVSEAADDKEDAAAKAEASKYLAEWQKKGATEDAFIEICKNSDDKSTADKGGETTFTKGVMVKEFENWCFDPARKAGDCEIVKSERYGYFLIYFENLSKEPAWHEKAADVIVDTKLNDYVEALVKKNGKVTYVEDKYEAACKKAAEGAMPIAQNLVDQYSQSAGANAGY